MSDLLIGMYPRGPEVDSFAKVKVLCLGADEELPQALCACGIMTLVAPCI